MAARHLRYFPKPLLDDLVYGRWLPVVGAGMSKNAVLSSGPAVPLWTELGEKLAEDMRDYDHTDPIDAISAYAHQFGRPRLVERLFDLLRIGDAQPGDAHRAFCSMQFDIVCTTNFDFLLEKQYAHTPRLCVPLLDQDQVTTTLHPSSVALLKLHGDLNHPTRLVATEQDYDLFLERYPVVATFLSYLFLTRTVVLVGYSLDDPDFRQLWQIVAERLGNARRQAYVVCVGARPSTVARFERRGVQVINLPRGDKEIGQVYAETFDELAEHWRSNVLPRSDVVEEEPKRELAMPPDYPTRLCFFAMPMSAQPFYREHVFPLVREVGLVPVTADQVLSPGDSLVAKIDALIARAFLVVVEVSTEFTLTEARIAMRRKPAGRTFIVSEEDVSLPTDMRHATAHVRPPYAAVEDNGFLADVAHWLRDASSGAESSFANETDRLLQAKEYRAAVISAITRLEVALKRRLDIPMETRGRAMPIGHIIRLAGREELLGGHGPDEVFQWLRVRNDAVHHQAPVSPKVARQIVSAVEEIVQPLSR